MPKGKKTHPPEPSREPEKTDAEIAAECGLEDERGFTIVTVPKNRYGKDAIIQWKD